MKLYLIRHGETTANCDKTYAGQTDVKLTDLGRQQALNIRPILSQIPFDKVFSSDLSRAIDTQMLAIPEVIGVRTPLLREYDVGSMVGKNFDAPKVLESGEVAKPGDYRPFGGEDYYMVCDRLRSFLKQLEQEPCENVAAFVHNGIMGCMLRIALGMDIDTSAARSGNCAIHVFDFNGKKWRLQAWNYMTYDPNV